MDREADQGQGMQEAKPFPFDMGKPEAEEARPDDDALPPGSRIIYVGARNQWQAIVSEADYHYLVKWKWNGIPGASGKIYVRRNSSTGRKRDGTWRRIVIRMHVVVMERKDADRGEKKPGYEYTPDHLNRKTLDNRRENLEWKCPKGQAANQRKRRR